MNALRHAALARLTWFVSITILLAGLVPFLSQAAAPLLPGMFAEVCSTTGMRFVAMQPGDDSQPGKPAGGSSMDCAWCALHHPAPLLPPAAFAWAPSTALQFERPLRFLQAPRVLFAWAPALARGPPPAA